MTVKELIEKLKEADPNAVVAAPSDNFEHRGAYMPINVRNVIIGNSGRLEQTRFVDVFDGTYYFSQTLETIDGNVPFVVIR